MATIKGFEDIPVWQHSRKLCKDFFDAWRLDPLFSRDYELLRQMKKSSGSVMDNIAEGYGRGGNKEFVYFLAISKGSCDEFKSQLYRALDHEYITKETFDALYKNADGISAQLSSFIRYLNKSDIKGSRYKVEEAEAPYGIDEEAKFLNLLANFHSQEPIEN
jgi:four helix bundle protein